MCALKHHSAKWDLLLYSCLLILPQDQWWALWGVSAHWRIERSDRTCQKVEPRAGNGPLAFEAMNLAEHRCQINSILTSSAQLALVSYPNMPNESNSMPSSLNLNNKKLDHLLKPEPWSSRNSEFMFLCSESLYLKKQNKSCALLSEFILRLETF